jgi:ADP-heptose:LPS heptosyltransferase
MLTAATPPREFVISTCVNPMAAPPPARRVLILRLGAVGDVVRTLPAARALRHAYADARLAWLVEPASASLLEGQSWLDEVIVFPRSVLREAMTRGRLRVLDREARRFVRELRERGFDLVVDFHAILKSGVLSWLSGAPFRASYARPFSREASFRFANHRARLEPPNQSRFDRNEALVRFLGVDAELPGRSLEVPAEAQARIAEALGQGPAPIIMHPGTSDTTAHKRWNVDGYAAVARELRAEGGPVTRISVGPARDDQAFAEAIVAAAGGAAQLAPETPSLLDLAALFARARLYVGSDTGPMHVASLVGTPVVQLLGPTDPIENQPFPGTPSRTVREQIACNPCRRGCAAATCMAVIRPATVLAAARELLDQGSGTLPG